MKLKCDATTHVIAMVILAIVTIFQNLSIRELKAVDKSHGDRLELLEARNDSDRVP